MLKFFIITFVFALHSIAYGKSYELQKVRDFTQKNGACLSSYGTTDFMDFELRHTLSIKRVTDLYGKNTSDYWSSILGQPKINAVLCIQNLRTDIGSINERRGCTLSWYNVERDSYDKVLYESSKICEKGGVDDIIPTLKNLISTFANSFKTSENKAPMALFGVKTFVFIKSDYSSLDSLFGDHLYRAPVANKDQKAKWEEWIVEKEKVKKP